jgi:hypothetical protein
MFGDARLESSLTGNKLTVAAAENVTHDDQVEGSPFHARAIQSGRQHRTSQVRRCELFEGPPESPNRRADRRDNEDVGHADKPTPVSSTSVRA